MSRMRYLKWTGGVPLELAPLLHDLLIEYNEQGYAVREVGLDTDGRVIHRYPSDQHRFGQYGLEADDFPVEVDDALQGPHARELSKEEFEGIWAHPDEGLPLEHQRHPGIRERLRRLIHGL
jgi:hypothetical protein